MTSCWYPIPIARYVSPGVSEYHTTIYNSSRKAYPEWSLEAAIAAEEEIDRVAILDPLVVSKEVAKPTETIGHRLIWTHSLSCVCVDIRPRQPTAFDKICEAVSCIL